MKKSLKIAIITPGYPPDDGGGIGTYTYNLARGLKELGHTVVVLAQSVQGDKSEEIDGIQIHRYKYRYLPKLEKYFPGLRWSYFIAGQLKELNRKHHFDIIEFPNWEGVGFAYLLNKKCVPVVTRMHTPYFETLVIDQEDKPIAMGDQCVCWLEKKACQKSDRLISSTVCHRDLMVRNYNLNKEKISILPLGIQLIDEVIPVEDPEDKKPLKILYVSRLEKRKGTLTLLDAVPQIVEQFPDVEFFVVGKDRPHAPGGTTFHDYFRIRYPEYRKFVHFHGFVESTELNQFYRECDVFAVPSVYESFGLIYIEAMMHGKPVVGCRAGGIPEVIDEGKTGFLVEPHNAAQLAEVVVNLLEQKELRQSMGKNARQACDQRFSYKLMAQRTEDLYMKIMEPAQK